MSSTTDATVTAVTTTQASVRRELRRQLLRSWPFLVGLVLLAFWTLCAIAPGLIATHDPSLQSP